MWLGVEGGRLVAELAAVGGRRVTCIGSKKEREDGLAWLLLV